MRLMLIVAYLLVIVTNIQACPRCEREKEIILNCYGKYFHCINETHFYQCADYGPVTLAFSSQPIQVCAESLICNDANKWECVEPSESSTTTECPPEENSIETKTATITLGSLSTDIKNITEITFTISTATSLFNTTPEIAVSYNGDNDTSSFTSSPLASFTSHNTGEAASSFEVNSSSEFTKLWPGTVTTKETTEGTSQSDKIEITLTPSSSIYTTSSNTANANTTTSPETNENSSAKVFTTFSIPSLAAEISTFTEKAVTTSLSGISESDISTLHNKTTTVTETNHTTNEREATLSTESEVASTKTTNRSAKPIMPALSTLAEGIPNTSGSSSNEISTGQSIVTKSVEVTAISWDIGSVTIFAPTKESRSTSRKTPEESSSSEVINISTEGLETITTSTGIEEVTTLPSDLVGQTNATLSTESSGTNTIVGGSDEATKAEKETSDKSTDEDTGKITHKEIFDPSDATTVDTSTKTWEEGTNRVDVNTLTPTATVKVTSSREVMQTEVSTPGTENLRSTDTKATAIGITPTETNTAAREVSTTPSTTWTEIMETSESIVQTTLATKTEITESVNSLETTIPVGAVTTERDISIPLSEATQTNSSIQTSPESRITSTRATTYKTTSSKSTKETPDVIDATTLIPTESVNITSSTETMETYVSSQKTEVSLSADLKPTDSITRAVETVRPMPTIDSATPTKDVEAMETSEDSKEASVVTETDISIGRQITTDSARNIDITTISETDKMQGTEKEAIRTAQTTTAGIAVSSDKLEITTLSKSAEEADLTQTSEITLEDITSNTGWTQLTELSLSAESKTTIAPISSATTQLEDTAKTIVTRTSVVKELTTKGDSEKSIITSVNSATPRTNITEITNSSKTTLSMGTKADISADEPHETKIMESTVKIQGTKEAITLAPTKVTQVTILSEIPDSSNPAAEKDTSARNTGTVIISEKTEEITAPAKSEITLGSTTITRSKEETIFTRSVDGRTTGGYEETKEIPATAASEITTSAPTKSTKTITSTETTKLSSLHQSTEATGLTEPKSVITIARATITTEVGRTSFESAEKATTSSKKTTLPTSYQSDTPDKMPRSEVTEMDTSVEKSSKSVTPTIPTDMAYTREIHATSPSKVREETTNIWLSTRPEAITDVTKEDVAVTLTSDVDTTTPSKRSESTIALGHTEETTLSAATETAENRFSKETRETTSSSIGTETVTISEINQRSSTEGERIPPTRKTATLTEVTNLAEDREATTLISTSVKIPTSSDTVETVDWAQQSEISPWSELGVRTSVTNKAPTQSDVTDKATTTTARTITKITTQSVVRDTTKSSGTIDVQTSFTTGIAEEEPSTEVIKITSLARTDPENIYTSSAEQTGFTSFTIPSITKTEEKTSSMSSEESNTSEGDEKTLPAMTIMPGSSNTTEGIPSAGSTTVKYSKPTKTTARVTESTEEVPRSSTFKITPTETVKIIPSTGTTGTELPTEAPPTIIDVTKTDITVISTSDVDFTSPIKRTDATIASEYTEETTLTAAAEKAETQFSMQPQETTTPSRETIIVTLSEVTERSSGEDKTSTGANRPENILSTETTKSLTEIISSTERRETATAISATSVRIPAQTDTLLSTGLEVTTSVTNGASTQPEVIEETSANTTRNLTNITAQPEVTSGTSGEKLSTEGIEITTFSLTDHEQVFTSSLTIKTSGLSEQTSVTALTKPSVTKPTTAEEETSSLLPGNTNTSESDEKTPTAVTTISELDGTTDSKSTSFTEKIAGPTEEIPRTTTLKVVEKSTYSIIPTSTTSARIPTSSDTLETIGWREQTEASLTTNGASTQSEDIEDTTARNITKIISSSGAAELKSTPTLGITGKQPSTRSIEITTVVLTDDVEVSTSAATIRISGLTEQTGVTLLTQPSVTKSATVAEGGSSSMSAEKNNTAEKDERTTVAVTIISGPPKDANENPSTENTILDTSTVKYSKLSESTEQTPRTSSSSTGEKSTYDVETISLTHTDTVKAMPSVETLETEISTLQAKSTLTTQAGGTTTLMREVVTFIPTSDTDSTTHAKWEEEKTTLEFTKQTTLVPAPKETKTDNPVKKQETGGLSTDAETVTLSEVTKKSDIEDETTLTTTEAKASTETSAILTEITSSADGRELNTIASTTALRIPTSNDTTETIDSIQKTKASSSAEFGLGTTVTKGESAQSKENKTTATNVIEVTTAVDRADITDSSEVIELKSTLKSGITEEEPSTEAIEITTLAITSPEATSIRTTMIEISDLTEQTDTIHLTKASITKLTTTAGEDISAEKSTAAEDVKKTTVALTIVSDTSEVTDGNPSAETTELTSTVKYSRSTETAATTIDFAEQLPTNTSFKTGDKSTYGIEITSLTPTETIKTISSIDTLKTQMSTLQTEIPLSTDAELTATSDVYSSTPTKRAAEVATTLEYTEETILVATTESTYTNNAIETKETAGLSRNTEIVTLSEITKKNSADDETIITTPATTIGIIASTGPTTSLTAVTNSTGGRETASIISTTVFNMSTSNDPTETIDMIQQTETSSPTELRMSTVVTMRSSAEPKNIEENTGTNVIELTTPVDVADITTSSGAIELQTRPTSNITGEEPSTERTELTTLALAEQTDVIPLTKQIVTNPTATTEDKTIYSTPAKKNDTSVGTDKTTIAKTIKETTESGNSTVKYPKSTTTGIRITTSSTYGIEGTALTPTESVRASSLLEMLETEVSALQTQVGISNKPNTTVTASMAAEPVTVTPARWTEATDASEATTLRTVTQTTEKYSSKDLQATTGSVSYTDKTAISGKTSTIISENNASQTYSITTTEIMTPGTVEIGIPSVELETTGWTKQTAGSVSKLTSPTTLSGTTETHTNSEGTVSTDKFITKNSWDIKGETTEVISPRPVETISTKKQAESAISSESVSTDSVTEITESATFKQKADRPVESSVESEVTMVTVGSNSAETTETISSLKTSNDPNLSETTVTRDGSNSDITTSFSDSSIAVQTSVKSVTETNLSPSLDTELTGEQWYTTNSDFVTPGTFRCLRPGKFGDTRDCSKYHLCVDLLGEFIDLDGHCPKGTVFDSYSLICTTSPVQCPGDRLLSCNTSGIFSHPEKCNRYYACSWNYIYNRYDLKQYLCPPYQTYNEEQQKCLASTTCAPDITEFECVDIGYFPVEFNCRNFYSCELESNNTLTKYVKTCSDNALFDRARRKCRTKCLVTNCPYNSIDVE